MAYAVPLRRIDRTALGVVTVSCDEVHPFNIGDKVNVIGVFGGGTFSFSQGMPFTVTGVAGPSYANTTTLIGYTQFTYTQTGAPVGTGLGTIGISSVTILGNQQIRITTSTQLPENSGRYNLYINGVTQSSGSALTKMINGTTYTHQMTIVESATSVVVTLKEPVYDWTPGGVALNWTNAYLTTPILSAVAYLDDGINSKLGIVGGAGANSNWSRIIRNYPESMYVAGVMRLVGNSKGIDYPFLRLVNVGDTSRVTKSRLKLPLNISQPPATWRSVFDSLIETFQSTDQKKRRYFINAEGQVIYDIISDTKPATANAPYAIITSGAGTPNAVNAVATIAPQLLEINYDHDTTKRALFNTSNGTGAPIADFVKFDSTDALGTSYTRSGAPYFDDIVDYPTGTGAKLSARQTAAKSYFLERAAPILSGSFTLRGAGTASWNSGGFNAGYALISPVISDTAGVWAANRIANVVTVTTNDILYLSAGMQVITTGFSSNASGFNGTFTIGTVSAGTQFNFTSAGTQILAPEYAKMITGDELVVAYGKFVRTGTAPNQIVTVTLPAKHGITTGAQVVVTGLTGTAGSTMVGTATATVIDDYNFTYPSTGTNGTATGIGTVSAYALIPSWQPGQWVDITCAELGLSGLYRVEQVDWRLEPGSFQQIITVTFNRRNPKLLTKMLREALT